MTIRGALDRLPHVFENLFRNTVEHWPGDVTIRVGLLGEDRFYVEVNGPGISPDPCETLSDRKRTSETANGGLKLPIMTWTAKTHGWRVTITEGPDVGTRVGFTGVEPVS